MKSSQSSAAPTALFPRPHDRTRTDDLLTLRLQDARAHVVAGSVTPTLDVGAFKAELAAFDFATPRPLDDVLAWAIARLERGIVHITHPRYLGLFNPGPNISGTMCRSHRRRVQSAARHRNHLAGPGRTGSARDSHHRPARRSSGRIDGTFHHRRRRGKLHCTICALTRACPGFALDGARAFHGRPVFYVSNDAILPG